MNDEIKKNEISEEQLESVSGGIEGVSGERKSGGICMRCGGEITKKRIVEQGKERDVIMCESCSSILRYLDIVSSLPLSQ